MSRKKGIIKPCKACGDSQRTNKERLYIRGRRKFEEIAWHCLSCGKVDFDTPG